MDFVCPILMRTDSLSGKMLLEGMDLQRRSRHIDIKVCWLRELLVKGIVKIQHVKGTGNPADHITQTLSTAKALEYMTLLGFLPFENLLLNSLLDVEMRDSSFSGVLSCFSVRQCCICGEPVEPIVDAEDKLVPPATKSEILGVEVDFEESSLGVVKARNTQDRVSEIESNLDEIIRSERLKPKELPWQLGRLQFADLQVAGRAGKMAMYDLRRLENVNQKVVNLESTHVNALQILRRRLTSGKPRTLSSRPIGRPWVLVTDGALE